MSEASSVIAPNRIKPKRSVVSCVTYWLIFFPKSPTFLMVFLVSSIIDSSIITDPNNFFNNYDNNLTILSFIKLISEPGIDKNIQSFFMALCSNPEILLSKFIFFE